MPWREILAYPPFRELLIFNLIYATVLGSLGVFTVEFLREFSHFDVGSVLYLSAFAFAGSPRDAAILRTGRRRDGQQALDASGDRRCLRSLSLHGVSSPPKSCLTSLALVAALNFLTGAASANFNLANVRITMATMPEMGRNHFFALFTVIASLGLGGAPVAWGMILDAIGSYEAVTGVFHWRRHSIYFLALLALNAIAFAYIPRLHESRRIPRPVPCSSPRDQIACTASGTVS